VTNTTYTATSNTITGTYSVTAPSLASYTVCVTPTVVNGSAPWKQTVPSSGATCSGKLTTGYTVTNLPVGGVAGKDFAGVEAEQFTCNTATAVSGSFTISFPCGSKYGTTPYFIADTWNDNGTQNILYDAVPAPTVTTKVPFLEKITWTYTGNAQDAGTLSFDDAAPYDQPVEMKRCNYDPRTNSTDMTLPGWDGLTTYTVYGSAVLPMYTAPLGANASDYVSCILYSTEQAPKTQGGTGSFTAYIYSEHDAFRSGY